MNILGKDLKEKLVAQGLRIVVGELTRDAVRKGLPKLKEIFGQAKKKTRKYDSEEEEAEE